MLWPIINKLPILKLDSVLSKEIKNDTLKTIEINSLHWSFVFTTSHLINLLNSLLSAGVGKKLILNPDANNYCMQTSKQTNFVVSEHTSCPCTKTRQQAKLWSAQAVIWSNGNREVRGYREGE